MNTIINKSTLKAYTFVPQLESNFDDAFNRATVSILCKRPVDKKFYVTTDMLLVKNTNVFTRKTFAIEQSVPAKPWRSPQFNNISFEMPPTPLLYPSYEIPKVLSF